ncbi:hypothetical protein KAW80_02455 [Candidatus Babeliales bacterium]|nr:hypothetical protein [Candidatus Babeliales bacterium]
MFEGIGSTWRESLAQFKWADLKILFLLSFKASFSAIKSLLVSFWWLLFIVIPSITTLCLYLFKIDINLLISQQSLLTKPRSFLFFIFVSYIIFGLLHFLSLLALRPSLERKDIYYFLGSFRYFLGFFLISILFVVLFKWATFFLIPMLLFYLDSEGRFKDIFVSVKKGAKLVLYFLPFFLIINILLFLVAGIAGLSFGLIFGTMIFLFGLKSWQVIGFLIFILPSFFLIVSTIMSSYLVNYYSKVKHSHYKLFS